ncbi:MAG: sigma-54-dependent transcriptional regulator, partial [Caulobacteraceae bacterium]
MSVAPSVSAGRLLFLEDDADVLKAAKLLLEGRGFTLLGARYPAEAWSLLAAESFDVILLDLNFSRGAISGEEGFLCLEAIMARDPTAVVVVVTGHSGVNIAVAAMRAGASDFVMKPWSNARLVETVARAVDLRRARLAAAAREGRREAPPGETLLLGDSASMAGVRALLRRAAPSEASVLIFGEAGTGKSFAAETLHRQS